MPKKKTKKQRTHNKESAAKPMPSLVYHEGIIATESKSSDVLNDISWGSPQDVKAPLEVTTVVARGNGYNPTARRLMWLGVTIVMTVVCGLWAWSLNVQLSKVKWSSSSEGGLLEKTREDWNKAFSDSNNQPRSTEVLQNEVKESLVKLFAGTAAQSAAATTTVSTTAHADVIVPTTTTSSTKPKRK